MGNAPNGNEVPFLMNDTIFIKLKAVMCKANGMTTPEIINDFRVYPNPVTDLVTIESPNRSAIRKIVMTDIRGKVVLDLKLYDLAESHKLNISDKQSGMYYVEVYSDNGTGYRSFFFKN